MLQDFAKHVTVHRVVFGRLKFRMDCQTMLNLCSAVFGLTFYCIAPSLHYLNRGCQGSKSMLLRQGTDIFQDSPQMWEVTPIAMKNGFVVVCVNDAANMLDFSRPLPCLLHSI
jgi:hypothetical protein